MRIPVHIADRNRGIFHLSLPPMHDLVQSLVRNAELTCRFRLGDASSGPDADASVAFFSA